MTTSTAERGQPWGRACGLLGACAVTLGGVAQQMDPDVILYRSVIAGATISGIVFAFRCVVRGLQGTDDEDE
ncbi:MAG: hypothetical protein KF774_20125 [Planctomyces sp.]|nr:hypothetical protein [Planctomyces sp.]